MRTQIAVFREAIIAGEYGWWRSLTVLAKIGRLGLLIDSRLDPRLALLRFLLALDEKLIDQRPPTP